MKAVFLLFFWFASNVHAQASHLECELSGNKIYGNSSTPDIQLTPRRIAVTVIQNQQDLIIRGEGDFDYSFSASTKKHKNDEEFKADNSSTASYYELSVRRNFAGVETETFISLDRVTGAIKVMQTRLFNNKLSSTFLGGVCKKIPSGNKF